MLVMGIDPGYAITGYGLVSEENSGLRLLDAGVIETASREPFPRRLEKIYNGVEDLLTRYRPQILAVEELFLSKNQTTAIGTAQGRGVVLLAAAKQNVPVFEYTPMQVKKAVTGYGGADKEQVQHMVQRLLGLSEVPRPDDMADALAVAICQLFVGAAPEFIAQSGYQSQARKKKLETRVNIGKLADQLNDYGKEKRA